MSPDGIMEMSYSEIVLSTSCKCSSGTTAAHERPLQVQEAQTDHERLATITVALVWGEGSAWDGVEVNDLQQMHQHQHRFTF